MLDLHTNATVVAAAAHEAASHLYAEVDFTTLSWLERLWVSWYLWFGNPTIATGVMSFIFHEVSKSSYSSRVSATTAPTTLPVSTALRNRTDRAATVARVLWALCAVGHHRRYSILPALEAPA